MSIWAVGVEMNGQIWESLRRLIDTIWGQISYGELVRLGDLGGSQISSFEYYVNIGIINKEEIYKKYSKIFLF